jgi:hypothetical protein
MRRPLHCGRGFPQTVLIRPVLVHVNFQTMRPECQGQFFAFRAAYFYTKAQYRTEATSVPWSCRRQWLLV